MPSAESSVIIVGGGIAGLSCACRLHARGVPVRVLEASDSLGGRIKTDRQDGFLLDRGFQVLQTAYPEARRILDYERLDLYPFAPGAMIRIRGRFYTLADPMRRPANLLGTLTAPIGGVGDRLRLLRLARRVTRGPLERLFTLPESTTMEFLRHEGFSQTMLERFFVPFFAGVCLDSRLRASSRVLHYVLRMFTIGDAALPAEGMQAIPRQLARQLPASCLRTGVRVRTVSRNAVTLDDGTILPARAVVVATASPETTRLVGLFPAGGSVAETCLYYTCDRAAWHAPFLMLNGEGKGPINNLTIPSAVAPTYAPEGKSLISVVVIGNPDMGDAALIERVNDQLRDWFGQEAAGWNHLATYRIAHALPDQSPPTPDPSRPPSMIRPGLFVCGEYGSLPGIQWALVSGRRTADDVLAQVTHG